MDIIGAAIKHITAQATWMPFEATAPKQVDGANRASKCAVSCCAFLGGLGNGYTMNVMSAVVPRISRANIWPLTTSTQSLIMSASIYGTFFGLILGTLVKHLTPSLLG